MDRPDWQLFSELELKSSALLMKCNADGLRVIALLIQGRMLAEAYTRRPGVTVDQIDDYINAVDDEKFEVGEVALVKRPSDHDNKHGFQDGDEVTVIEGLKIRRFGYGKRHWSYIVTRDGRKYRARPIWLRKKYLPPPREELGEWELCPWQPKHSTVSGEQT